MSDPAQFARACDDAARALRRVPKELRRELARRTKAEVADPLAARIRTAGSGVYAVRVSATAKARSQADPTIVVGGARRVASGGARARDLVFGNEFGGGSRTTSVPGRAGRRGYRRRTTRQFIRNSRPFVYPTVSRNVGWILDQWARIVDDVLEREIPRG